MKHASQRPEIYAVVQMNEETWQGSHDAALEIQTKPGQSGRGPCLTVHRILPQGFDDSIYINIKTGTASAVPAIWHGLVFRTRPAPSSQWQPS